MAVMLAAAAWGFAEATLFFLVPDILLSLVAMRSQREALRACVAALAGAMIGGVVMYRWGSIAAAEAIAVLDKLPAVSTEMIETVGESLRERGYAAMLVGPLSGTPYKLYAVQAGALGLSWPAFVLTTIPARLIRFIAVTLLAAYVGRQLPRGWSNRQKYAFAGLLWFGFYALYFAVMPN